MRFGLVSSLGSADLGTIPPSRGCFICLHNGRRTTAESLPEEKECAEYDPGGARRAAYVAKQEGRFQRMGDPKDKSPYYFNIAGDISIITICG